MAVPGREPKDQARNRTPLSVDWIDVQDKPYTGRRPTLPTTRTIEGDDGPEQIKLHPLTKKWWETVSKMPHAINWTASDWILASTTALVADTFYAGKHTVAAELRIREDALGVTAEARRKLRIRYLEVAKKPAAKSAAKKVAAPSNVTNIDERRARSVREG